MERPPSSLFDNGNLREAIDRACHHLDEEFEQHARDAQHFTENYDNIAKLQISVDGHLNVIRRLIDGEKARLWQFLQTDDSNKNQNILQLLRNRENVRLTGFFASPSLGQEPNRDLDLAKFDNQLDHFSESLANLISAPVLSAFRNNEVDNGNIKPAQDPPFVFLLSTGGLGRYITRVDVLDERTRAVSGNDCLGQRIRRIACICSVPILDLIAISHDCNRISLLSSDGHLTATYEVHHPDSPVYDPFDIAELAADYHGRRLFFIDKHRQNDIFYFGFNAIKSSRVTVSTFASCPSHAFRGLAVSQKRRQLYTSMNGNLITYNLAEDLTSAFATTLALATPLVNPRIRAAFDHPSQNDCCLAYSKEDEFYLSCIWVVRLSVSDIYRSELAGSVRAVAFLNHTLHSTCHLYVVNTVHREIEVFDIKSAQSIFIGSKIPPNGCHCVSAIASFDNGTIVMIDNLSNRIFLIN